MLRLLRANPAVAIPVILTRLHQKDQEWRRVRGQAVLGWAGLAFVFVLPRPRTLHAQRRRHPFCPLANCVHPHHDLFHSVQAVPAVRAAPPLLQVKAEMMVQWQQIFKENYHKSLDHRSFYFKQTDKKLLTRERGLGGARCKGIPLSARRFCSEGDILAQRCAPGELLPISQPNPP